MAEMGRPLAFKTPEQLDAAIEEYFNTSAWVEVAIAGTVVKQFRPTMSGLALAIGVDRRTLVNYAHKDDFFPSIKKARATVESALESKLYDGSPAGVIFNLKNNFAWDDKSQLEHSGSIDINKMSDDELERRIAELSK